jgi:EAL domain-containing protein (putative c-di-GMP-specific phosphodiesterase class I)
MYVAKREDGGFRLYSSADDHYSPDRLALVGELRWAIEQGQLLLHYQPKVNLKTGQVEGVEALVRWQHPQRGFVPPDQFIPLAEHTGAIKPLTSWVIKEALQQCRLWEEAGLDVTVAVNLSARTLHDPQLVTTIAALLEASGVEPCMLEVELTESAVMADASRAQEMLTRLHEMGVRISVDDFGTGHSSLAYLKRLPVDHVKIDRSFVMDMTSSENDYRIVRATINLGHAIGLKVVAEGVEDSRMLEILTGLGCDQAQGYYLSRPLPAPACTDWLNSRLRDTSAAYSAAS